MFFLDFVYFEYTQLKIVTSFFHSLPLGPVHSSLTQPGLFSQFPLELYSLNLTRLLKTTKKRLVRREKKAEKEFNKNQLKETQQLKSTLGTKLYKQGPAEGDTATKVYTGDEASTSKVQLKKTQQLKSTLWTKLQEQGDEASRARSS